MAERRILIVANQTAGGTHLKQVVKRKLESGPCKFTLLVPATPPTDHATWTDEQAIELAAQRMEQALEGLRALGADIRGTVGDISPVEAIGDELRGSYYDEIILSTLPPGISRWLKQDLPSRVQRRYDIPVTHILAESVQATK